MKRPVLILFCSAVVFLAGLNCSFAATIATGAFASDAFAGWDANFAVSSDDPTASGAVSVTAGGVATLSILQPLASTDDIYISRHFTGVSAISALVDFNLGDFRQPDPLDPPLQGYISNVLNITFYPDNISLPTMDLLGYDKTGVFLDPSANDYVALYGSPYAFSVSGLGGIDGTLAFYLRDSGDTFFSQGLISDVTVTEAEASPVPEPSTLLCLGGGLVALLLSRSRRRLGSA